MKIYTIIGGVNGVGKSSFLGILKEIDPYLGVIIDTNDILIEATTQNCISANVSFNREITLSGYKTEATAKQVKELPSAPSSGNNLNCRGTNLIILFRPQKDEFE